jgi:hypothetical protein
MRGSLSIMSEAVETSPTPDLVVVWEWLYDRDFVDLLRHRCSERGVSFACWCAEETGCFADLLGIWPRSPRVVLDRASDAYPELIPPLTELARRGAKVINNPHGMVWCSDKATMHLELLDAGVRVPYAVVVSSEDCAIAPPWLPTACEALGSPFVIKPALGGGGEGVVLDAESLADVESYLKRGANHKVILQRLVEPRDLEGRRAWFRVLWVYGRVFPCWWDDRTHIYAELSAADEAVLGLGGLREIAALVAARSGMHLFSTEIAMDAEGVLMVVDFVNEMPDLRSQREHADGVPESVVEGVAEVIVGLATPR